LEMSGILVSVLKVTDHPDWLDLLDAPTSAPAWPATLMAADSRNRINPSCVEPLPTLTSEWSLKGVKLSPSGVDKLRAILSTAARDLLAMEESLNLLDSGCGDGDCGSTHAIGAKAILAALPTLELAHPHVLLQELGILCQEMGGSSGGVYSLLFTGGAGAFQDQVGGEVDQTAWVRALRLGLETVMKYGGAEPGDRTMIDALHPALVCLEAGGGGVLTETGKWLRQASAAARKGAEDTSSMIARAGRASYVSRDKVKQADPGAVAASTWFNAIAAHF